MRIQYMRCTLKCSLCILKSSLVIYVSMPREAIVIFMFGNVDSVLSGHFLL
jgi:hypothetical protein